MRRWWASLLAVLVLAGLAVGGFFLLKAQPEQAVVWAARQDLDLSSRLDATTLVRERMRVKGEDGGELITADIDLSGRSLRQQVKKGVALKLSDLAELETIVRAVRPVDKGTPFEQAMFEPHQLPPNQRLAGSVGTIEELLGRVATVDLQVGDQVLEGDLIDLIDVPVPSATVKRGRIVPELDIRQMLPVDVPVTAILTATLAEGRLALVNLYQGEPILAADVCDYREVPVPAQVIGARTILTVTMLAEEPVCLARISPETILEEVGLVGKMAVSNLPPHLPVQAEAIDDPVVGVWVPARVIAAGAKIQAADLISITIGAREVITPGVAVSANDLVGRIAKELLLPGKLVQEGATQADLPAYAGTLELVVTDAAALGGTPKVGSLVDVYASPRLFLDSTGKPVVLDVPGLADHFPVRDAEVVLIESLETGGFRVRLRIGSIEGIQAIMEAAPRVELHLVIP